MTVLTASQARANLYRLIDEAAASHEPSVIAGKRASAVLISQEDWQAIQETLHLLSIPGMRKSIRDGMAEPLAKSAKELTGDVFTKERIVRVRRMWTLYA